MPATARGRGPAAGAGVRSSVPAPDLAAIRFRQQLLAWTPFDRAVDTVSWFGAVQAQDYPAALWAVGLRTRGATQRTMEEALAAGSIVRTWPLRGTLHLVAAADVRWLLALLGPGMVARSRRRMEQLGLAEPVLARARAAFARALEGGGRRTRPELRRALEDAGVDTSGQRGYHLLRRCAVEGLICLGPRQGKQHTFVLLDEWVPLVQAVPRDEALAGLALRYFTAHGPATTRDFAWWSGLAAAEARRGVQAAAGGLLRTRVGGATYWSGAAAPARGPRPPGVRLLPAFDEYLVGYRDRAAVLAPAHIRRVNAGGGLLGPTVALGGRIAGVWQRRIAGKAVAVEVRLFAPPGRGERDALEAAAAEYGRFLGLPAELTVAGD